MQMMAATSTRFINERPRCRKDIKPRPLERSVRDLPPQSAADSTHSDFISRISTPHFVSQTQPTLQIGNRRLGKRYVPILVALAGADHNLAALEVDILDPQRHTLVNSQPASI